MSREADSMDEELKALSMDYLNLFINGQAFSDVAFRIDNRLVHAHRCVLAARSLFFRKFFSESPPSVIPIDSIRYDSFLLLLQFLYSGRPPSFSPDCGTPECPHTHCTAVVDLTLDTLNAASVFGVEQLLLLTQRQLNSIVEKATIEDVMRVLLVSHKHKFHHLCSITTNLVSNSDVPTTVLVERLPLDIVSRIEEVRSRSPLARRHPFFHHPYLDPSAPDTDADPQNKLRRMRRALDSSNVELVRLMVAREDLDLDRMMALHYAVENCTREVVKALLEIGAADVNRRGPGGRTPLHVAAEMSRPDMVSVLLDHHADPNAPADDGVTPLDVLRVMTSDFMFRGTVPRFRHVEPNRLRLCLELVQSAALVMSREKETQQRTNCKLGIGNYVDDQRDNDDDNDQRSRQLGDGWFRISN